MLFYKAIYWGNLKADNFSIKLFALVFFALLVSQNSFAHSSTDTTFLTEEEQTWIAEHPLVKTLSSTSYAPFDFMSGGQPAGLSIDYLNLVGAKVGLKFEYVRYDTWPDMLEGMQNKEIDLTHSISKSEQRSKYLNFSAPYYNSPMGYFGRAGSPRVSRIEDINDKRIGVIRGSIIEVTYKKKHPHLNLIEFENNSVAINALLLNEIDVFVADLPTVDFYISQSDTSGVEALGDDLVMENGLTDQRIAALKDNPVLMTIINKGMAAVSDEEFKAIRQKWIQPLSVDANLGLTQEELQWLSKNKVIKVAAEREAFPETFIDQNGNIAGIAGDYLNEISKRLNIEFVWAGNETWDDGLLKIKSDEIEMFSAIIPTKSREELFEFTEVYSSPDQAIFTTKGSRPFRTLESLNGYSLVQIKGTTIIEYLKQDYPDIKIIEVGGYSDALELLSAGTADAFIADIQWLNSLTAQLNIKNLIVTGISPYKIGNAMGVRANLPLLASSVRKALANINPIRRQEIINKWQAVKIEPRLDYTLLWIIVSVGSVLLITILFWNNRLRREVKQRKNTELKLSINEKRWRTILDNSASGLFVINSMGKISIVNKTAEKMFGYDKHELLDRNISMLMNKLDKTNHDTHLKRYLRTGNSKIIRSGRNLIGIHKNGNEFPIHIAIGEIIDEFGELAFIGSITDITEIKQKEIQLEEALDTKTKFLASMSHDLRTPLNAIIGFSEVINTELYGPIGNKKYADYSRDIYGSGKYLLQLVNDILDLSKLEAGKNKLEYETFDFYKLVLECQSIVYKLAEDKDIDLYIRVSEDGSTVCADRLALTQIVMNLVSNAIKFTPPNGSITISAHVSDDKYIIKVIDTGCGISKENIELIIKPFVKATESPYVSHTEGAGLGLAIAKSLIELHGGDLAIDSILDKGTTVTVTLPLITDPTDI